MKKIARSGSTAQSCCSTDSERRARETALLLKVPFYKLDFKKEFREKIADPFIEYYNRALTPNPCVWCNSRLRFTLLMDRLKSMGIDYLATGHYAKIKDNHLFRAKDREKDQSYFLYNIPRQRFKNIIFPLESLRKNEVYKIAKKNRLPVSSAKESQDCCILMEQNLKSYLSSKVKMEKGDIVNPKGETIGTHTGYQNYTVGQRKRLGGLGKKNYVIGIDPEKNRVVAGDEKDLYCKELCIRINSDRFFAEEGEKLKIKIRYRHQPARCRITGLDIDSNICKIEFEQPQRAPTPGQSGVLYRDDEVVGGGEIIRSQMTNVKIQNPN
jgi:tRNA-specific 2-thiouridylase